MALLVGGLLAFRFLVPPWRWVVLGLLVFIELGEILLGLRLARRRSVVGPESLVGETGRLAGRDRVRIRGTSYRARVVEGEPGDDVVVVEVEGMTLVVRRSGPAQPPG
jgi:membrane protein implicated in regulation of membrane protease activity